MRGTLGITRMCPPLNSTLIAKLVNIIRQKQKQDPRVTIELILNEAGIHSVPPQAMAEARAEFYQRLNIGISAVDVLKQHLTYFIADHDVFRVSELRYYFPGDKEQALHINLEQLGYVSRDDIPNEQEPVWCPKYMQQKTILKKLERPRIGSKKYLDYLFYQPQKPTETIIKL